MTTLIIVVFVLGALLWTFNLLVWIYNRDIPFPKKDVTSEEKGRREEMDANLQKEENEVPSTGQILDFFNRRPPK
jgi:hypothetical protein